MQIKIKDGKDGYILSVGDILYFPNNRTADKFKVIIYKNPMQFAIKSLFSENCTPWFSSLEELTEYCHSESKESCILYKQTEYYLSLEKK